MAKRVTFTAQARADIQAIPQPVAIQILRTLARHSEVVCHGLRTPCFAGTLEIHCIVPAASASAVTTLAEKDPHAVIQLINFLVAVGPARKNGSMGERDGR